jgi:hypothetical protein
MAKQHATHTRSTHDAKHKQKAEHHLAPKPRRSLIPERYHDWLFVGALLVAVLAFLRGTLFGGGGFLVSDNIASGSFTPYLDAAKQRGIFPLWIPYIFSGMPSYAALLTTGDRWWDVIMTVFTGLTNGFGTLFGSDAARVGSYYILYGIGMYLLMRSKQHERFVAFFAAFAAIFSTWVIVWVMIGHNTKPWAIATFPYILLWLEKLRERFSLLYATLLVIAVHILVESTHVQMVFYGVCCFSLYIVFELVARLIKRDTPLGVLRAAAVLAVAGGLSFAMAADRYLSVMEYTPYSTRGTAPIEKTAGNKQDASGGNDYEYATNWSFSPQEMITFFVPNYYGFGKLEYSGPLTNGRATQLSTYWGQMPFTDAANYMGIGVLLFAIIGCVRYWRKAFVQFLIVLSIFSLLLSFGKNFSLLYDVFFYYVPGFNKFRAPQMALALLQFAVPILAGYGLTALLAWRREHDETRTGKHTTRTMSSAKSSGTLSSGSPQRSLGSTSFKPARWLLYGTIAAGVFLVSGLVFSTGGQAGYVKNVLASETGKMYEAQGGKEVAEELAKFVFAQASSDWIVTGVFAIAFMFAAWLFVRGVLSQTIVFTCLAALLIGDLWRVAVRPLDISKEKPQETVFRKTDVVTFLQQDKSLFRIIDFTSSPNVPAYFKLQHAHGYHSAKLRVYQDLLDVAGKGGGSAISNPFLWNLLNVKYLVLDRPLGESMPPVFKSQEGQTLVYENPSVLPRAFFVDTVEVAPQIAILHHLRDGDFSPLETMYIEQPLSQPIDSVAGELVAHIERVKVLEFDNEYIKLEATATGNNVLFMSEVYYPAGWKAMIDGKETPIIKANYAFRAVVVPPGKHVVEMRFTSSSFELGKTISLAANSITIFLLIAGVWFWHKESKEPKKADNAASTESDETT